MMENLKDEKISDFCIHMVDPCRLSLILQCSTISQKLYYSQLKSNHNTIFIETFKANLAENIDLYT